MKIMTNDEWIKEVGKLIASRHGFSITASENLAFEIQEDYYWDDEPDRQISVFEGANLAIELLHPFYKSFAPEIYGDIQNCLCQIERDNDVRILFAIESGSRAWGFPSPDSDYDVRFVYVRPRDWYLSIEPGRDVIELPIEGDMDINGWDLKKALGLLLKPNPVLLEWLSSPVKYIWNEGACDDLLALAKKVTHGHACLHHYLSLGSSQKRVYLDGRETVNLKKYFYVVRPAMVIRWLRMNPTEIPPMNFFDLKRGIDLGANVTERLDELLRKKSESKELGEAPSIKVVDDFISAEFDWAEQAVKALPKREQKDLKAEADELFRKWVK